MWSCCHDAIAQCWIRLNSSPKSGGDTWVLDADLKGFFDNISHESILSMIKSHPNEGIIKRWLKAGYVDEKVLNTTETGTPQGGVISPLLANIGLHGLSKFVKAKNEKLGFIRYADDFVVTAKDKESLEEMLIQIKEWLAERGLNRPPERIVHIDNGFDFLGFNLRHYNGKLLIKPPQNGCCRSAEKSVT